MEPCLNTTFFKPNDLALDEFIKNRYLRFSPSAKQLNDEFYKYITAKSSGYTLLLENLKLFNNGNNLFSALKHIKEIALCRFISTDNMSSYFINVFVNLLHGTTPDVIEAVRTKTFHEFRLFGTKQDEIMNAYYKAVEILISIM